MLKRKRQNSSLSHNGVEILCQNAGAFNHGCLPVLNDKPSANCTSGGYGTESCDQHCQWKQGVRMKLAALKMEQMERETKLKQKLKQAKKKKKSKPPKEKYFQQLYENVVFVLLLWCVEMSEKATGKANVTSVHSL